MHGAESMQEMPSHLQKAWGSSAQPYMGAKKAPVLGPYRPTELKYCLIALRPSSTLISLSDRVPPATGCDSD